VQPRSAPELSRRWPSPRRSHTPQAGQLQHHRAGGGAPSRPRSPPGPEDTNLRSLPQSSVMSARAGASGSNRSPSWLPSWLPPKPPLRPPKRPPRSPSARARPAHTLHGPHGPAAALQACGGRRAQRRARGRRRRARRCQRPHAQNEPELRTCGVPRLALMRCCKCQRTVAQKLWEQPASSCRCCHASCSGAVRLMCVVHAPKDERSRRRATGTWPRSCAPRPPRSPPSRARGPDGRLARMSASLCGLALGRGACDPLNASYYAGLCRAGRREAHTRWQSALRHTSRPISTSGLASMRSPGGGSRKRRTLYAPD